ncbi:hypothetical protein ABPG72_022021 [Tetrahymena utriculariae]
MEQRKVRYDLKIHYVRSNFGTCNNYYQQMINLIQLEGLQFSNSNIKDLGGKPGVGSFFQCCCYVDPHKWASEKQIYEVIYPILLSKNMFPSRGYEERLKVELSIMQHSEIQPQHLNSFSFPPSQKSQLAQQLFQQDQERFLSDPIPFRNSDFLQDTEKDTTCDVTSLDILSCIDQTNNNQFNPIFLNSCQQSSQFSQTNQVVLNGQQQQLYQLETVQSSNQQQREIEKTLRSNQEQQIDSNNQQTQQNDINLSALMEEREQNKNDSGRSNNLNNIFSNLLNQNELSNTEKIPCKNAALDNQQQDKNNKDGQSLNSLQQSSSSNSQQNLIQPLNIFNDLTQNSLISNQLDLNKQKSSISQNQETDQNSFLQKKEESNQKNDASLNKTNNDQNSQNRLSQTTQIKLISQTKSEEESISNNFDQVVQNQDSFNEQESEIQSQMQLNETQYLNNSSNKLINTGDGNNLALKMFNVIKQDSYDPFLNDTINDNDISKEQSNQIETKLLENTLNDSEIKQEEQKEQILNILQMKSVDMKQEKEQVYIEQTNYQIKMLIKEVNLEKQKNHQLLKEKQKDKEKLNLLESNAINYLTENSELKQQVSELQEKLDQTQEGTFNQDILAHSRAQLQEINQEKAELKQQKEQNSDIHKDLYIEELKQTLNEARNEILFLRKELSQKSEMLEILKEIQKSIQK